ncbi:trypsin Inhibitor like cysteine rich domain protein [Ancylostoma caninum]|uniref:Trypsin Inhibitor like cysteine rich domain protein n=1 Tax=Ancylostoma caninum TaxID=29170 RepID=A0A368G3H5_ANCCA|nr:trypsin Inhibitor like cysteine rich domain protein [Ancylostoma caninum]
MFYAITENNFSDRSEQCGENEKWGDCEGCEKTCDDLDMALQSRPCRLNCVAGCVCEEGFFRDLRNGNKCVLPGQCITPY